MNWKRPLAAAAICAGLSAGLTGCETGMDNRASVARSTGPSATGRFINNNQSEPSVTFGGERYAELPYQGFQQVAAQPLSTFSLDVDTAGQTGQ